MEKRRVQIRNNNGEITKIKVFKTEPGNESHDTQDISCVTSRRHLSVTPRSCKRLVYLKRTSSGLDAWYVTVLLLPPALPSTSLSSLVTLSKRTLADSSVSVSSVTGVTLWHNASALTASWTRETTVRRTYEDKKIQSWSDCTEDCPKPCLGSQIVYSETVHEGRT